MEGNNKGDEKMQENYTTGEKGRCCKERKDKESDKGERGREVSGWREGVMSKVKSDHKWEEKRGR